MFRLDLKDLNGTIIETAEGEFDAADVDVLRQFNAAMQRVRDTALLRRGLPRMTGMGFNEQGLMVTCPSYTDQELHELLHVLRPVMLSRERTSFEKVSALLGRRFANQRFRGVVKELRRRFEDGAEAAFMQFTVHGHPIFDRKLLDTWLNGTQYHTDEQKAEAWKTIEGALQTENARGLIITQIHGRVHALLILDHIANVVAQNTQGASLTIG